MKRNVVVISHADADGHLIAEQTRRNLDLLPFFNVQTIIDPVVTRDHKVWMKLDNLPQIDSADVVFFVDLMFGPTSFAEESKALVSFVRDRPNKQFFLVDHHPVPLQRLGAAPNLRAVYRPDVFECAIGPRSGMMVVAALCEKQRHLVAPIAEQTHVTLARGMKRAAALGGPLPGEKLLNLLRADAWGQLLELGRDDPTYHRLPRGRRPAGYPISNTLESLNEAASSVAADNFLGSGSMAYDLDQSDLVNVSRERYSTEAGKLHRRNARVHSKDLEAIVTVLEVAALTLAADPDTSFTFEKLLETARDLADNEFEIDERDVKIVLEKASFLERAGRGEYRLR